jgi:hypothetical protein
MMMNPKKLIMEFLKKKTSELASQEKTQDSEKILKIIDGMGVGTAMLVIENQLSGQIGKEQKVEGLENMGRYYVARIVERDGAIIQRLMVDKQSGIVRFITDRGSARSISDG